MLTSEAESAKVPRNPGPRAWRDSDAFPMREAEFVVLMASLMALISVAIDVMLPALARIGNDLGVTDANHRQLVIGVYLVAQGAGSLLPGSLSDRYGRRPVVLGCLAIYAVLALGCALVTDFTTMLVLRAAMGFLTSGLMVLPMAIVRDRFSGDRMARTQSLVGMTFMVMPMVAPLIGQAIMLLAGWRWIFGFMALAGGTVLALIALRLPETLHAEYRQPIRLPVLLGNMREAATTRSAIGYFLGGAAVQASMFGYINSAEQLVAEHFGAGKAFPLIFGGMALIMAGSNFTNSRIVERFGTRRVAHTALIGYIVMASIHFVFASRGEGLWTFVPLMTLTMCLNTFLGANFQAIALQPFARIAGAAASVMSFIRVVLGAAGGVLVGQAFDGTARPLVGCMAVLGCLALLLVAWSENWRLFRRLHNPDGSPRAA